MARRYGDLPVSFHTDFESLRLSGEGTGMLVALCGDRIPDRGNSREKGFILVHRLRRL